MKSIRALGVLTLAWLAAPAAAQPALTIEKIIVAGQEVRGHPNVLFEGDSRPLAVGSEVPKGMAVRVERPGIVVKISRTADGSPRTIERYVLDCGPETCPLTFKAEPRDANDHRSQSRGRVVIQVEKPPEGWVETLFFPKRERPLNVSVEGTTFVVDTTPTSVSAFSVATAAGMVSVGRSPGPGDPGVLFQVGVDTLVTANANGVETTRTAIPPDVRRYIDSVLNDPPVAVPAANNVLAREQDADAAEARGIALRAGGRAEDARRALSEALTIRQSIVAESKGDVSVNARIGRVHAYLGDLALEQDASADAENHFKETIARLEPLQTQPQWAGPLAQARIGYADLLVRTSRSSEIKMMVDLARKSMDGYESAPSDEQNYHKALLVRARRALSDPAVSVGAPDLVETAILLQAILSPADTVELAWLYLLSGDPLAAVSLTRSRSKEFTLLGPTTGRRHSAGVVHGLGQMFLTVRERPAGQPFTDLQVKATADLMTETTSTKVSRQLLENDFRELERRRLFDNWSPEAKLFKDAVLTSLKVRTEPSAAPATPTGVRIVGPM